MDNPDLSGQRIESHESDHREPSVNSRLLLAIFFILAPAAVLLWSLPAILGDVAEEYLGPAWVRIIVFAEVIVAIAIANITAIAVVRVAAKIAFRDTIRGFSELERKISQHDNSIAAMTHSSSEKLGDLIDKRVNNLDKSIEDMKSALFSLEKAYDSVSANKWYLSAAEYADRERAITKNEKHVTVYIISDSLSFDVQNTAIMRAMKANLSHGVCYRYIVKGGLEKNKEIIRVNAKNVYEASRESNNCCGDVKFYEVKSDEMIFAFDYAIFRFDNPEDDVDIPHFEIYMALENGSDPAKTPWMKLSGDSKEIVEDFATSIPNDAWKD